ncbi:MAG: hypothetical protein KDC85_05120 [Saprospiraceae bacterium]|nr:hypothetical protein [Saprospiraceae bacterium]MCB9325021.1 hypothetical protein [Lewinellaceae bacterium]
MKQRFIQISLFLLLLTSWSCKKEDMFLDRLEGTWNIDRLERYEIHPDGSAITLTDEKNVGTLSMKVATIDGLTLDNLKDFEFNYTENGNAVNQIGVLKVDEQAKRVIILGGDCIQCDIAYTVEINKKNEQVWSTFSYDQQSNLSYKLTYTLRR